MRQESLSCASSCCVFLPWRGESPPASHDVAHSVTRRARMPSASASSGRGDGCALLRALGLDTEFVPQAPAAQAIDELAEVPPPGAEGTGEPVEHDGEDDHGQACFDPEGGVELAEARDDLL